jgi:hypothetical protein
VIENHVRLHGRSLQVRQTSAFVQITSPASIETTAQDTVFRQKSGHLVVEGLGEGVFGSAAADVGMPRGARTPRAATGQLKADVWEAHFPWRQVIENEGES